MWWPVTQGGGRGGLALGYYQAAPPGLRKGEPAAGANSRKAPVLRPAPAQTPERELYVRLYESPRKVEVKNGQFTDWFGPEDVHVYRLGR